MKTKNSYEPGAVSGTTLIISGLAFLLVVLGGLAIWSFLQYNETKTDVDGQIALAVSEAEKVQAELDEEKFAEREKEPNRQFVGPDDYGRVTFDYPKTWSVYVAKDVSNGGTYEAYLNPVVVPPIKNTERYALRVTISNDDYDDAVKRYESLVKDGALKSSAVSVNGVNGTRLDGNFTKDIRGSAVLYKIRDKVLTVRTDAETFKSDFEKLIKTIEFNQ